MLREDVSNENKTNSYRSLTQNIPCTGAYVYPCGFTLSGYVEHAFAQYKQKTVKNSDRHVYFKSLSFLEIDSAIPESDESYAHTDLEHSKAHVVPR